MGKVNPDILTWAINWNGFSIDVLAKAFPGLSSWIDGTKQPTFKQLEKFSSRVHLAVPYFFSRIHP